MTTEHTRHTEHTEQGVLCPRCQQLFRDDDALRQHGLRAHFQTRQQHEEQHADAVMDEAVDRQQDAQGRREQAGQPGGAEPRDSGDQPRLDRGRGRMDPAHPGEDIPQQTQQQQRQVD